MKEGLHWAEMNRKVDTTSYRISGPQPIRIFLSYGLQLLQVSHVLLLFKMQVETPVESCLLSLSYSHLWPDVCVPCCYTTIEILFDFYISIVPFRFWLQPVSVICPPAAIQMQLSILFFSFFLMYVAKEQYFIPGRLWTAVGLSLPCPYQIRFCMHPYGR